MTANVSLTHARQHPVLALHLNKKLLVCQSNNTYTEVIGLAFDKIVDSSVEKILHKKTPKSVVSDINASLHAASPWMGNLALQHLDGSVVWVKATLTPLLDDGESASFLLTFTQLLAPEITSTEKTYASWKHSAGPRRPILFGLKKFTNNQPIGRRIGFLFTALTALLAALLISNQLYTVQNLIDENASNELAQLADTVNRSIEAEGSRAASLATLVASLPQTKQAMVDLNREQLAEMYLGTFNELSEKFGLRQFQFHTAPATSFLRLHKPAKFGDDLSSFRHTVVKANNNTVTVQGLEKGRAGYGIRGVVPIMHNGKGIGTVEFGSSFTQFFFENFKTLNNVDIGFYSLVDQEVSVVGSTFQADFTLSQTQINGALNTGSFHSLFQLNGEPHSLYIEPMHDYSGKIVGVVAIAKNRTPYIVKLHEIRKRVILISLTALLICLGLSYLIARGISQPISSASKLAKAISNGVYDNVIPLGRKDEIGQLQKAMSTMQSKMAYNRHETAEVAEQTARIKLALDYIYANVTVSDPQGNLIFINESAIKLFGELSIDHARSFNKDTILGTPLNNFFNNPELTTIYNTPLKETKSLFLSFWEHDFKLIINPVFDDNGEYVARVTQWLDITSEVVVEQEIKRIVVDANNGDLSGRISTDQKEGFFADLANGINSLIGGMENVFIDIDSAMKNIATGNLTQPINKHYTGTFGSVKDSVNNTIIQLESMVRELQNVSTGINAYAAEISSSNDELSKRTEQQASSVEETASSMEEITGTVRENSSNTTAAITLAAQAQEVSSEGVGVVQKSITAMESINDSSRQIEEIIGVIDEIAFQTNLLALNAAVEAARAGEQGRGFAVVASEVRDLAGRSSDAAKQIKKLISDSVQRVSKGTELVNNAGLTLDEIANSIGKVNSIISEIAHSNEEQSRGIELVNNAVTLIDSATQQNSSLAEETSSVAVKLSNRSIELDSMIGKFTISNNKAINNNDYDIAV